MTKTKPQPLLCKGYIWGGLTGAQKTNEVLKLQEEHFERVEKQLPETKKRMSERNTGS